jgi:hypothetical protein
LFVVQSAIVLPNIPHVHTSSRLTIRYRHKLNEVIKKKIFQLNVRKCCVDQHTGVAVNGIGRLNNKQMIIEDSRLSEYTFSSFFPSIGVSELQVHAISIESRSGRPVRKYTQNTNFFLEDIQIGESISFTKIHYAICSRPVEPSKPWTSTLQGPCYDIQPALFSSISIVTRNHLQQNLKIINHRKNPLHNNQTSRTYSLPDCPYQELHPLVSAWMEQQY